MFQTLDEEPIRAPIVGEPTPTVLTEDPWSKAIPQEEPAPTKPHLFCPRCIRPLSNLKHGDTVKCKCGMVLERFNNRLTWVSE